jgi:hypothetical protein
MMYLALAAAYIRHPRIHAHIRLIAWRTTLSGSGGDTPLRVSLSLCPAHTDRTQTSNALLPAAPSADSPLLAPGRQAAQKFSLCRRKIVPSTASECSAHAVVSALAIAGAPQKTTPTSSRRCSSFKAVNSPAQFGRPAMMRTSGLPVSGSVALCKDVTVSAKEPGAGFACGSTSAGLHPVMKRVMVRSRVDDAASRSAARSSLTSARFAAAAARAPPPAAGEPPGRSHEVALVA